MHFTQHLPIKFHGDHFLNNFTVLDWAAVLLVYAVCFPMPFLKVFLVIVPSACGHKRGHMNESISFLWS